MKVPLAITPSSIPGAGTGSLAIAYELRSAQNALDHALQNQRAGQADRMDAAVDRLVAAERAVDRSRGIDPDACMTAACQRQQRAALWSDMSADTAHCDAK